jgi:hypothetical protein
VSGFTCEQVLFSVAKHGRVLDPSSVDFKTSGTWYELFFQVS